MRARERRVADAVSSYLVACGGMPEPRGFVQAVGVALGVDRCALVLAGERHEWREHPDAAGPDVEVGVDWFGEQQGVWVVPAEAAAVVRVLDGVLGLPAAVLRLAAETDRLRRDGDAAARQLVDDRWRAAAEMERERRALERDLHDGAQHHLVALRMAIALAAHTGAPTTDLLNRLDAAERVLLDTAAGVLPVALVTEGLGSALSIELANHPDVRLDISGLRRRYPPTVESTVFFLCLEAVNNARKHAPGAQISVTTREDRRGLAFTVTDTGPGFTAASPNSGLHNLSSRATAVGGTVEIRSAPGKGTTVTGFIPW
ncbi:sensor histidine kinase [Actinokineospora sp. NPDC004072]